MKSILITNDDGIAAPGLKALVDVAQEFGNIVVIAPDSPQSAKSHAITLSRPIRFKPSKTFPHIEAYECSGTPVDCVKLAKNILFKDKTIDLCLSGVNHGSNASLNILYSGTVSAAMETAIEKIDSIAFSLLNYSLEADFEAAKPFMRKIIHYVLSHGLFKSKLLNVNIPSLNASEIKGIKVCRQAQGHWIEEYQEAEDPRGEKYFWTTGRFKLTDKGSDTDIKALDQGYISIVPSHHDLTEYSSIDQLSNLENV